MGFYKFGLYLLFCSHQLLADSYWSHMPGVGSVQLTALNPEQQLVFSQHMGLSAADAKLWLNNLPKMLEPLSCSTLNAKSQSIPAFIDASYKLVSYAGLLKWASDDSNKSAVWWLPWSLLPLLFQQGLTLPDTNGHAHQPMLLSGQQLEQNGKFIIISGSNSGYFALQLNIIDQPVQLWSVSSEDADFAHLANAQAQPLLLTVPKSNAAASLLLPDTAAGEQNTLIYKVDLLTGVIRARLNNEQKISDLSGALAIYDHNMDSVQDTVVFSTKAGQVWQVQIENDQFYNLKQIADLSGLEISDIQFIRTLYAAVPVGGSGSDFHSRRSQWLVLLSALKQRESVFVVLKHQNGSPAAATDLVDRTLASASGLAVLTEQNWQHIQQQRGWYSRIPGRLTQVPIVAAGVVYLTLLHSDAEPWCSEDSTSLALLALHLYHASSVYRQPILALEKTTGALAVKANAEGGFALIEKNNQQVLIDNLLEISPDCAHCSKTMQQHSFPRWQLMGTYHREEGAYE